MVQCDGCDGDVSNVLIAVNIIELLSVNVALKA